MTKIGEFELLVVLSILRHPEAPYANRIRDDLAENARRSVTRGALYRTLDRLEAKGFIEWELEPDTTPARGGHPMRRLSVTGEGVEAARSTRDVLLTFFDGLADPSMP